MKNLSFSGIIKRKYAEKVGFNMKKFMSILLAIIMIFSCVVPAMATAEEKEEYPEGNPFESESEKDIRSTRRIDLSELKFGRNYSGKGK